MLASLGLSLEFPSFSQGLEAILAEGDERTGDEGC
jgi:hypothetical protein